MLYCIGSPDPYSRYSDPSSYQRLQLPRPFIIIENLHSGFRKSVNQIWETKNGKFLATSVSSSRESESYMTQELDLHHFDMAGGSINGYLRDGSDNSGYIGGRWCS